ncbi:TIGR00270 family protein [Candidatus Woesearchaeota archaeon]|nr:TIGR00270 family protein [Candidatus Woesearchaeota archaeon]
MTGCELCGRNDVLVFTFIEGVKFKVCSICKKFGKVLEENVKRQERPNIRKSEFTELIVDNFNILIKSAREKICLSQSDLANKLNEKESIISKVEQGSIKPNLELAKKLEKFFDLKLIFREELNESVTVKSKSSGFTIGDFVKKDS